MRVRGGLSSARRDVPGIGYHLHGVVRKRRFIMPLSLPQKFEKLFMQRSFLP